MSSVSTSVNSALGECQICWEPLTPRPSSKKGTTKTSMPRSTRVDHLCRSKCPAELCLGCVKTYVTICVDKAFAGVLPKVRCPVCLGAMNKARWEHLARPATLTKYISLCRTACSFISPCCRKKEYTHLPISIQEIDPEKVARQQFEPRPWMPPSAKRLLPALGILCRKFMNHRATSQEVIACIEEITASGGDTLRLTLYEHVLVRILDEERRATLLLSYHHKYKMTLTRCHSRSFCFKCKREASFQDGIHPDWSTCNEPPIKGSDITECPSCLVTIVKSAVTYYMVQIPI